MTGTRLELLADFFRTFKMRRKKLELKAKDYRKIGRVGRSTSMTEKKQVWGFFYWKLGKIRVLAQEKVNLVEEITAETKSSFKREKKFSS